MQSIIRQLLLSFAVLSFAVPAFANSPHGKPTNEVVVAGHPQQTVVNINTADVETFVKAHIKGIGKKRAAAIVAYREQHGAFKSIDDLKNIKGLSEKVITENRARLTLG